MLEAHAIDLFQKALLFEKKGNRLRACEYYETLLQHFPNRPSVIINLTANHIALENYSRLEELLPELELIDEPMAHLNAGTIHYKANRRPEALKQFEKAFDLDPTNREILRSLAVCLFKLKRPRKAAEFAEQLANITQSPTDYGRASYYYASACDWENELRIRASKEVSFPFFGIARNQYEHENLDEAVRYAPSVNEGDFPKNISNTRALNSSPNKLRIGYLCGEFREHATLKLLISVLELHDQSKFDIFYFDNGFTDESTYRARLEATNGSIINIYDKTDTEVQTEIKKLGIDILINLNGYFGNGRTSIFFQRAAPVQVSYLGYPATLGHPSIDYIIADSTTIPHENEHFFIEKIYRISLGYQPNDLKRPHVRSIDRDKYKLPNDSFLFCCLNNTYKITKKMFETWATILKRSPKSILLLLADNDDARTNLLASARALGVSEQIKFIIRLPTLDYIEVLSVCDLFLDTSPYNAHTTATDALWAGTPILTMPGNTFPSRVGLSLLRRTNIDESLYVSINYDDYADKAVFLATNPEINRECKRLLASKVKREGGFIDMNAYTRELEQAFTYMYSSHQKEYR